MREYETRSEHRCLGRGMMMNVEGGVEVSRAGHRKNYCAVGSWLKLNLK